MLAMESRAEALAVDDAGRARVGKERAELEAIMVRAEPATKARVETPF